MSKKSMFIFMCSILALVICEAIIVPFNNNSVNDLELIIKFGIAPLAIVVLIIPAVVECYRNDGYKNKFVRSSIIMPLLTMVIAVMMFFTTMITRNHQYGNIIAVISNGYGWVVLVAGFVIAMLIIFSIAISTEKFTHKSKVVTAIFDIILLLFVAFCLIVLFTNIKLHMNENYDYGQNTVILVSSILGAIAIGIVVTIYIISSDKTNKEISRALEIQKENESKETDVLLKMYNYSKEQLEARGYEFASTPKEVEEETAPQEIVEETVPVEENTEEEIIAEEENVKEEAPVEEEVSTETEDVEEATEEVNEESVAEETPVEEENETEEETPVEEEVETEEEAPVEEVTEETTDTVNVTNIDNVEETKVVEVVVPVVKEKVKKIIKPTPKQLLKYVQNNFTDTLIVVEEDDESFKAYRGKKMFINLSVTTNDYRMVFQRKPISITRLLVKYNTITKAKSPAGDQWFKLVNKGDFEEADLQNIIKFSYNYLVDEEEKALLKKQKEKEKALEKKRKEREKAKLAALKLKEKEKKQKANEAKEQKANEAKEQKAKEAEEEK